MTIKIIRNAVEEGKSTLPADMHPVLKRVFAARGIRSGSELELGLDRLLPANALSGVDKASALLHRVMAQDGRILIMSDFDADGATSCALAVRALRMLGARHVDYLAPNRFDYGYGLSPAIVEEALKRRPDLLVTVDNGISSHQGVEVAAAAGVPVLITDHHLPGETLPAAAVLVNPQLPGDRFSSKHLAGVGVIFYVMLALRAHLRSLDWFRQQGVPEPNLAGLLDLVALGTVADVVPLDHNNRIMVHQGLQRIRAGRGCAGINALIEVAGRTRERLVAADLGFAVAPRLNAAGRLDDMSLGIECLLSDDPDAARAMAHQLDELNHARRHIEGEMVDQAMAGLSDLLAQQGQSLPIGLCIYREEWHQGVVGILASRIRERFHRPVIGFAPAQDGLLKGSARSVPGLHLRDVLAGLDVRHPGMIMRFGGHAMAAGLTLSRAQFEPFCRAFDEAVRQHLGADDLSGVIHTDGALQAEEFTLELAELLRTASPWGQGFPEPCFDGEFRIRSRRLIGGRHLKLQLSPAGATRSISAMAFNQQETFSGCEWIRAAYRLDVNQYRGACSLQLVIENIQAL